MLVDIFIYLNEHDAIETKKIYTLKRHLSVMLGTLVKWIIFSIIK